MGIEGIINRFSGCALDRNSSKCAGVVFLSDVDFQKRSDCSSYYDGTTLQMQLWVVSILRTIYTDCILATHLDVPSKSTLTRRKSEDDLGECHEERKKSKFKADSNYVQKVARMRVRAYCCQCDKDQGRKRSGACSECLHNSQNCLECLLNRSR